MISADLSGKIILIRGALGDIAAHIARRPADAGTTLVLGDIKENGQAAAGAQGLADSSFLLSYLSSCQS